MLNVLSTVVGFPSRDADRLRLALRGLDVALAAQADALAVYRGNLGALRDAVGTLDGSLSRLHHGLGDVGLEACAAAVATRRLDATADQLARAAVG